MNHSWNSALSGELAVSVEALDQMEHKYRSVERAVNKGLVSSLSMDQQALQIHLALQMRDLARSQPTMLFTFEQEVKSEFSSAVGGLSITVFAVNLEFVSTHALQAKALLEEIKSYSGAWPAEVRACQIIRRPSDGLTVRCVLHIYHWSAGKENLA